MPLTQGKSKKAFEHNLKAEMHAGKPQKQALAISYAIQKRAEKKAKGGEIHEMKHKEMKHREMKHEEMERPEEKDESDEHYAAIADAILAKRGKDKEKMMADGGEVDLHENAEEEPNQYYKLDEDAVDHDFDADMDAEHDADHIDMEDHDSADDEDDIVEAARRRLRGK